MDLGFLVVVAVWPSLKVFIKGHEQLISVQAEWLGVAALN